MKLLKIPEHPHSWKPSLLPGFVLSLILGYVFFICIPALKDPALDFSPWAYLPHLNPIGMDLMDYLEFSRSWLNGGTPYVGTNYYPPFQALFFAPLTRLPPSISYIIVDGFTLGAYLFLFYLVFLAARRSLTKPGWPILIPVVSLCSYGFLFELARGQFDLIAMAFCAGAIALFHARPGMRWIAVVLFCVAVQLKLYPLIFLVVLIDPSEPWRRILRRWAAVLLANLLLLLCLGWNIFTDFIRAIQSQVSHPSYAWLGNHSISSFLTIPADEPDHYSPALVQFADRYGTILALLLMFLVVVSVLFLFIMSHRKHRSPYNAYLIFACVLGAMLIPSTSHDYKLSLLGPAVAYLLITLSDLKLYRMRMQTGVSLLASLISLSFSVTWFSLYDRPFLLRNSFPLLFLMLVVTLVLFNISYADDPERVPPPNRDEIS